MSSGFSHLIEHLVTLASAVGVDVQLVAEAADAVELILAEGVQKVRQGMQVNPKPYASR